ncbi:hypothetical protein [Desulfosporosinus youngiae]|uniref:Uncharacterized protein n=1 Tax=Desulfosporosinus youngiae DSM 17734 TaxID=768710 RepID=H5XUC1_9FIRM|nr:hypothetical protein [Desulfosporosinus youngiae]EHQ89357.1 hypothetical protein DesyoDRAFT_2274 [Desulfosporosinus youngiae DSM 17734]
MLVNLKRLLKKELCAILNEIGGDSLILDAGERYCTELDWSATVFRK